MIYLVGENLGLIKRCDWLFPFSFFARGKLGIKMMYLQSVFTNSKPIVKIVKILIGN
jgi:hypothetical protein